ncbi:hypothetical protein HUU05_19030 [candidate division KSB1 bacterium]|nr:hypothetical protein [candidate division KSB1 bacterium]
MNFNTKLELVNFIATAIKQGDVGFFFGAGISSNSGIPVVNPLLRKILHELSLNETESEILLHSTSNVIG